MRPRVFLAGDFTLASASALCNSLLLFPAHPGKRLLINKGWAICLSLYKVADMTCSSNKNSGTSRSLVKHGRITAFNPARQQ
jgi:hypothetical protein